MIACTASRSANRVGQGGIFDDHGRKNKGRSYKGRIDNLNKLKSRRTFSGVCTLLLVLGRNTKTT